MAIKTHTADTVREQVVAKAEAKAVGKPQQPVPVEAPPAETVAQDVKPDSTGKGLRQQLEALLKEKRELEEFAHSEYELRVKAEALAKQAPAAPVVQEPPKDLAPDPDDPKYAGDSRKFLEDRDAWNRREALREFQKEQDAKAAQAAQERAMAEFTTRREASLNDAKARFSDFDDVLKSADVQVRMGQVPAPPAHVQEALMESDYMAHLLYHFASNPEEAKKLFELPPKRAALAIGRLETRFEKKQAEAQPTKEVPKPVSSPTVSKAPAPIPSLSGGEGVVVTSPAEATSFQEYRRLRMEELKAKGNRRR